MRKMKKILKAQQNILGRQKKLFRKIGKETINVKEFSTTEQLKPFLSIIRGHKII